MHKPAAIILTVWCALNFLVAAFVTAATVLGQPPPALRLVMTAEEIARVDPKALAVIHAQAALANPLIMALTAVTTVLGWSSFRRKWALIAAALLPIQAFGFVSDGFLGGTALIPNLVSTAVLLTAIGVGLKKPG